jgi:hypothetical protein
MLSAAGPADSRALLLALIATACACPTWGGAPYRVLEEMADDLDAGGSFVEIGSDRGEGSTSWLSGFASRTGRDFFSVDFAPEGHENARRVCGVCAHRGLGEEFLSGDFSKVGSGACLLSRWPAQTHLCTWSAGNVAAVTDTHRHQLKGEF